MQAFVDGLNWYQDHVPGRRRQCAAARNAARAMGDSRSARDRRLAGDRRQLVRPISASLAYRGADGWPEPVAAGVANRARGGRQFRRGEDRGFDARRCAPRLQPGGSNCVVVSPARSATGGALLASAIRISPRSCPIGGCLAGVRSPSVSLVGLMPAGLPMFGLGRDRDDGLGRHQHARRRSELFDVSGEPTDEPNGARCGRGLWPQPRGQRCASHGARAGSFGLARFPCAGGETSRCAGWGTGRRTRSRRCSRSTRARRGPFRAAFADGIRVAGQNMLFARPPRRPDRPRSAAWLPRRDFRYRRDLVSSRPIPPALERLPERSRFPWARNPPDGFIASANDPPPRRCPDRLLFPRVGARAERLEAAAPAGRALGLADLEALQRDVAIRGAAAAEGRPAASLDSRLGPRAGLRGSVAGWNGRYETGSAGRWRSRPCCCRGSRASGRSAPDVARRLERTVAICSQNARRCSPLPVASRAARGTCRLRDAMPPVRRLGRRASRARASAVLGP